MIVLDNDQESFVRAYLEKQLGEVAPKGVKALSDYLEALDKAIYKRMMTAYRADKKRRLDREAGNESVNVALSKNAHKRLKAMAESHGVTLSHFIEHHMNNGFIASEENLNKENVLLKEKVSTLNSEIKLLQQDCLVINNKKTLVEIELDKFKRENKLLLDSIELDKEVLLKNNLEKVQCQSETKKGCQCQNLATKQIKTNGFYINVCEMHYGLLSASIRV